jgi:hypothetical protein
MATQNDNINPENLLRVVASVRTDNLPGLRLLRNGRKATLWQTMQDIRR